ncbi:hypothetical protein [Synechococcus sp. A18-25c]|uniref:hypothetical protein n=1 Tax=Synechococcus sp. A18-25c TaxID=1866938 RepID=UPI00210785FB|nr:hypothetical protein [Synechococcus sp. A18-25c]
MERLHLPTEFDWQSSPRTALNQPVVEVDAANAVKGRCLLPLGSALQKLATGFGEGGRQLCLAGFAGHADRSLNDLGGEVVLSQETKRIACQGITADVVSWEVGTVNRQHVKSTFR